MADPTVRRSEGTAPGVGVRSSSGRRAGRRTARRGGTPTGAAPRLHLGRIAVLALVLIAASFYVSPLRAFFGQQDRYERESAALAAARADNAAYKLQVELLTSKEYVAQRARADSMLVPPDTQVFVIKGLPDGDGQQTARPAETNTAGSISVLDRLDDLWRTLLR